MYTKTTLALAAALTTFLTTFLATQPAGAAEPAGVSPPTLGAAAPTGTAPGAAPPTGTVLGACGPGRLCLWPKPDFKGRPWTHELATTDIDSCVALPPGTSAQSLANRTGRPVTTYQSAECGETGEFETYPGRGTWVPQTAYEVRAFKLWER
ncbi:peptidase inhibitor family I36 protein [Streptomyces sp. NPDC057494]|uniref:peptidase inhibitor family I36 protein n=1 Tax=Streptomyces sp. NPDC057494 TaxID=3346148 RepID=UPI0036B59617